MEKLARADIIAEQRSSIAGELQRMRKDIAQQEAWVKVPAAALHARALCTPKKSEQRYSIAKELQSMHNNTAQRDPQIKMLSPLVHLTKPP